jgi:TPR repeat protein
MHGDLDAAQRGDPEAAHRLGLHYRAKDPASARAWLAQAAHGGNPAAMVDLALELRDGHGGPRDLASAQGWLRRAATAGEPRAACLLAEVEARLGDRHSQIDE